jgi:hypothetical protein
MMRVIAVAVILLTPTLVAAQTTVDPAAKTLSDALFVSRGSSALPSPDLQAQAGLQPFATPDFVGQGLSGQPTARVAATGQGLIAWSAQEVSRQTGDGAIDTLRISTAAVSRTPLVGPNVAYDPHAVDVTYVRGWPSALSLRTASLGVDVTPHAGFGVGSGGGRSAEAGAVIKVSAIGDALRDRLEAMGVKNGSAYGDQGRLYLFAAVNGRAVGMNMQETDGALRRTGWSTDVSSALVGDGQIGVGWRKGGMEASVGYVHRGVHLQNGPIGASDSYADDMAAVAFTYHPHW